MDGRRASAAGSGIPTRSGIARPGIARPGSGASHESGLPRPSSRADGAAPATAIPRGSTVGSAGPMGTYKSTATASTNGRNSMGLAPTGSLLGAMRQPPSSAAPATRTYAGLAGRISTVSARPLDNSNAAPSNMLGLADDSASASHPHDNSNGAPAHKRSVSAAGMAEDNASFAKRSHLRKLSLDGTSPLLLQTELHPASTPRPESAAYEISVLRTHYDQQLMAESRKYKKLEEDYEAKCKELDRFNRQRVELLNEWDKQQEQKLEKEHEWTRRRQSLEDEVVRLRAENSELTHKLDEMATSFAGEVSELRARNLELETQMARGRAEMEAAKARNQALEEQVAANKAEIEDLQNALEDEQRTRIQERDEYRFGVGADEAKKISNELRRQASHLRKLEADNAHLTAENGRIGQQSSNVELLKEEKRSLEGKLRVLDELRSQLAERQIEIQQLKTDKQQWEAQLKDGRAADIEAAFVGSASISDPIPRVEPPQVMDRETLPRYLSTLIGTVSGLTCRCGSLSGTVDKLRARNLVLEEAAKDIDAKERKQQSEVSRLQSQLLKAEKTETRLEDEIERLKAMLASYETEEKNHQSSTYDAAHGQRIALLEAEMERLRGEAMTAQQQVENISARLAEAQMSQREAGDGEDASSLRARVEALQREKTTLESKVVGLEADVSRFDKEREEIWRENEMLWGRVGRGEFNQEKQRCLVLAQNPVSQELDVRKKTLDALKAENRGLLQRVEELSSVVSSSARGGGDSQTLVPQAVVQNLRNDIEALGVSIAAKDKAMLRLKQVFSAKANEFREAIQSLFGYKVKFLENGKVKLTSTFNRGKNSTSLIFESEDGNVGKMNLMGEAIQFPGLVNLAGLKEYWLDPNGIRQSVPCFLAALNLELYESCTMAVRRSGVNVDDDQDE